MTEKRIYQNKVALAKKNLADAMAELVRARERVGAAGSEEDREYYHRLVLVQEAIVAEMADQLGVFCEHYNTIVSSKAGSRYPC